MDALVKQLKGEIANPDLHYLDAFSMLIPTGNILVGKFNIISSGQMPTFELLDNSGNAYFADGSFNPLSGNPNPYTPNDWDYNSNLRVVNNTGAPVKLLVKSKMNISKINILTTTVVLSPSEFLYSNLTELRLVNYYPTVINLKNFNGLNVTTLYAQNGAIEGDIANFADSESLAQLEMRYSSKPIFGTMEELVSKMFNKGRRSGAFTLKASGSQITLNNANINSALYTVTFGASSVVISNDGSASTATYDGAGWTYSA